MDPSEARKLGQLREENVKPKRVMADLSLDKVMLQDVLQNKVVKPFRKREIVRYLMGRYDVSQTQACRELRVSRSSFQYCSHRDPQQALRQRIVESAHARVRFSVNLLVLLALPEGFEPSYQP